MSGGGASQGPDYPDKDRVVAERIKLTDGALAQLGLPPSHLTRLFLEDSRMTDEMKDEEKLAASIRRIQEAVPDPDVILVPSYHDDFPDHRAAHRMGELLLKAYQARGRRPELWNFCVWIWFYHPLKVALKACRSISLRMTAAEHEAKDRALDIYVSPDPATGVYWSGHLPSPFVSAHRWGREIFYKE